MRVIYSLSIFILMLASVWGQSLSGRSVKIIYYLSNAEAPKDVAIYSATENDITKKFVLTTELPRKHFSSTFKIPKGDQQLYFSPREIAGEDFPLGAPKVSIPKSYSKVILLVFEDKKNKVMPIRVVAIDAGDDVFGPGDLYVINYTDYKFDGTLGEKKITFEPKSDKVLKNIESDNKSYPASIDVYYKDSDQGKRFIRQMWRHDNHIRRITFILLQGDTERATYYTAPIRNF